MASYEELYALRSDSALRNKVAVSIAVAADTIRDEDVGTGNHANRYVWAAEALAAPLSKLDEMFWTVLAVNNAVPVGNITGATDAAIQAQVNAAVDLFATG